MNNEPMMSTARWLSAVLPALALAACASVTPYQPLQDGVGYSDQKLESNRFRVSFAGNSSTPRETVENYVLYRTAEVTLANGYDYFTLAAQTTEAELKSAGGSFGFGIGGIGIGRHGGLGIGIGSGTEIRTEYQGSADVNLFHGKKPDNDPHAYDARQLRDNLESTIARPKPEA